MSTRRTPIEPAGLTGLAGLSAAALILCSSIAAAQAPRITTAGDPSVRSDTIYRLAVDPARHPEEAVVRLFDDGVLRYEADATGSTTYRVVDQILRPEAVDGYAEEQFSYAPKHQRFTLNWLRVVKPDGTVISAAPSHVQESDVPAQFGDPTYTDRKVIRVSVSGVAPGTIVDYSYTVQELKPFLPGDWSASWFVNTGNEIERSRYIIDVPANYELRIHESNLNFARTEKVANGRRTYTWTTHDLARIKGEAYAADSNGVSMAIQVSSPTTWAAIAKWYAGNAQSRYVTTPAVDSAIHVAVKDARTLGDSIRAVHRWIAQDIRYVALAIGLGGYQPRTPDDVVRTGYGDCKDKATLFIVALNHFGVPAFPVLLSSVGGVRRDMPSIGQLDHVIAAFRTPGSAGYEYADLTASLTPLGELPFGYQGEFGLVVHPDGQSEEITFPKVAVTGNESRTLIAGTVSEDGMFNGTYNIVAHGVAQYVIRGVFENPLDSAQRATIAKAIAASMFEGAEGDSLTGIAGKDLAAVPRLSVVVRHGRVASMAGSNAILTNPLGSMTAFAAQAREIETAGPRLMPLDAAKVLPYGTATVEFRVTLPDGWHVQLPKGVTASGEFGSYHSEYSQTGREFVASKVVTGATGIYPPDQVAALVQWMRDVSKDDAKLIVIDKGSR